jgi:P27 family predicted phage terminase small subunit
MAGGRPRKPTKLKILEGNRGKRKLSPESEPQPSLGTPDVTLSGRAQAIYDAVAPELDRLGLLAKIDGTSLKAACMGAAQAEWADSESAKLQAVISTGTAEQNDFYRLGILNAISKKGWQQWGNFSARFGLDPASRGKLTVNTDKQADPIAAAIFA